MAQVYKVLGQVNGTNAVLTDAYTVPAATSAIVSSIVISNRSGVADTYSVSVAVAGAADAYKQYLCNGVTINANSTITLTLGITLAATDVVRVIGTALSACSFNIFGTEITA